MKRIILGIAAAFVLAGVSRAAESREIVLEARQFFLSSEVVVDPKDGGVRLAHSTLLTHEAGATDHRQTVTLSDRVWAMTYFTLTREDFRDAEVFICGTPKHIEVEMKPLPKAERLASTGWTRAKVPPEFVAPAGLAVRMRGSGQLLFEPGRLTKNSLLSTDGGVNWSPALGPGGQAGEFLVRLRCKGYGLSLWRSGRVFSPVFDLWSAQPGAAGTPGRAMTFKSLANLEERQPQGCKLYVFLRTGPTPSPDDKTWAAWKELDKDYKPDEQAARHRWAQLKVELHQGPSDTPRLPAQVKFAFDFQPDPLPDKDDPQVVQSDAERAVAVTSVPFTYQAPSPRLKLLRERYKLDEVIAPGKTEMEQLTLLRWWVRNQWHTAWQGGNASWMPPWDAHIILECKDQTDCLTMCTHYAAVFTQCCLALGWTARHCILDHHCVSEVFVNQHNKWVMMDAGNSKERADVGLHFERNGVPLSALELHLAYHQKKTDGITVHFTPKALAEKIAPLCRPEPAQPARPARKAKKPMATGPRPDAIPLAELEQYPVCQINNYRRYAFPARNNYLDSLLPGELYQGWSSYFYDGYWWVGDSPDDPKLSPEYSKHLDPARPQDIDWSLNWTRIHLARTAKAGELQVDLETLTPNFARFEMLADGKWKPTPARFTWTVQKGENALRVRSVNQFERPGVEASVQVKRTE